MPNIYKAACMCVCMTVTDSLVCRIIPVPELDSIFELNIETQSYLSLYSLKRKKGSMLPKRESTVKYQKNALLINVLCCIL